MRKQYTIIDREETAWTSENGVLFVETDENDNTLLLSDSLSLIYYFECSAIGVYYLMQTLLTLYM